MMSLGKGLSQRQFLGEPLTFWLWCAALLYMTAPLEIILTGSDPDKGLQNSLPYYNYSRLPVGLISTYIAIEFSNRSKQLLGVMVPYFVFFVFEMVCTYAIGMNDRLPFTMAAVFGGISTAFAAAATLGTRQFAKCSFFMLVMIIIGSIITAIFDPAVGVHSGLDLSPGAGRGGEWRGIYTHKNYLGHVSGITAGITLCFGRFYLKSIWYVAAIFLISVLCMIMSHSSSAIVLCFAIPSFYYSLIAPKGYGRMASIAATVLLIAIFAPFRTDIISFVLRSLGKSEDLSGRSSIWRVAEDLIQERPLFGGGIGYTASQEFRQKIIGSFGVNNVHNAFIDAVLCFGFIGSFFLLAAIVFIVASAWLAKVRGDLVRARSFFTALLAGWFFSGFSEVMANRTFGVITQIGIIALVGLASVTVAARSSSGRRRRVTGEVSSVQP